jgi:cation:H+ antiporter
MVLLTFSAFILMFFDGRLDEKDSLILIVLFIMCVYFFQPTEHKKSTDSKGSAGLSSIIVYLLLSLGMLIYGSTYFINGATQIATALGVSAYVIGLTLAALGTSLPELAASIQSARKGKFDFIVGNIIGSNLFNIAIAMSIAGIISSSYIEASDLARDILMLGLSTLVFYIIIKSNSMFRTVYSVALVITYLLYLTLIFE